MNRQELLKELQDNIPRAYLRQYESLREDRGIGYLTGVPGSGTLFVAKGMLLQAILGGDRVIIIDDECEYKRMLENIGIKPIYVGSGKIDLIPKDFHVLHYIMDPDTQDISKAGLAMRTFASIAGDLCDPDYDYTAGKPIWIFINDLDARIGDFHDKMVPYIGFICGAKMSNTIVHIRDIYLNNIIDTWDKPPLYGRFLFDGLSHMTILGCDDRNRRFYKERFNIPDEALKHIRNAPPGHGLVINGKDIGILDYRYPSELESYKIMAG